MILNYSKDGIRPTSQLFENGNFRFLKTTKVPEENTGNCFYNKILGMITM